MRNEIGSIHRTDDGNVINATANMGKQIADLDPAFAVLLEFPRRCQQVASPPKFKLWFGERQWLPVHLDKLGLRIERFDAEIRTAAEVGVQAVRTVVMPGRRYEQFKSLTEVRESEAKASRMLELAVPIVTKHRVKLAVENHKDQRIDERIGLDTDLIKSVCAKNYIPTRSY